MSIGGNGFDAVVGSSAPKDGQKLETQGGFFYLEVLFAMTLLAFATIAIAPTFLLSAKKAAVSRQSSVMTMLAHAMAERLETESLQDLSSGSDVIASEGRAYVRTWQIERDRPLPTITTVMIEVRPAIQPSGGSAPVAKLRFRRAR